MSVVGVFCWLLGFSWCGRPVVGLRISMRVMLVCCVPVLCSESVVRVFELLLLTQTQQAVDEC